VLEKSKVAVSLKRKNGSELGKAKKVFWPKARCTRPQANWTVGWGKLTQVERYSKGSEGGKTGGCKRAKSRNEIIKNK